MMRKLWLALFATVTLLLGGVATASDQMHGGSGGRHGGHSHDGRFHHFDRNAGVFIGAPAFWWGPTYDYPVSRYDGPYASPVYGDPGSTTYIEQYSGTAARSGTSQTRGGELYDCTDQVGYYLQLQTCAKGWLKVPDDHARAVALKSKELNNAEQFAKANGCPAPAAKMNFAFYGVDNFETFTVACGSERPMSVRCDNGRCRVG